MQTCHYGYIEHVFVIMLSLCLFINPQHTCTATVIVLDRVCLCLSVCLSVSHISLEPENIVTYSSGNGGQTWGFL